MPKLYPYKTKITRANLPAHARRGAGNIILIEILA